MVENIETTQIPCDYCGFFTCGVKRPIVTGSIDEYGLNQGKLQDFYKLEGKKIGEGAYGSVSTAVHKSTGSVRAVKTMSKQTIESKQGFQLEPALMKSLKHPNIIELYETFVDDNNVYLVMEVCEGGEILDRISQAGGRFSERQTSIIMKQVFSAVSYMHLASICHRDLKLENLLLKTKEGVEKDIVKLVDFGIARWYDPQVTMSTAAGTVTYQAPEVMAGSYGPACDLWSCGVIMYTLLVGFSPFHANSDAAVVKKVKAAEFSFDHKNWKEVSADAKDLIKKLLVKDPTSRCTAAQALATSWVKDVAPNAKKPV